MWNIPQIIKEKLEYPQHATGQTWKKENTRILTHYAQKSSWVLVYCQLLY